MSRGKGFTLVEMVVVLAIISILGLGMIGGYHYVCRQQMIQVAKEIQTMIEVMQQKAALTNGTYKLRRDGIEGKSVCFIMANDRQLLRYNLPNSIHVFIGTKSDPFAAGKAIIFTGDVSPSESGTLSVWHRNIPYHMQITVQPVTGLVTLYPIEENLGGESVEEYLPDRLYGVR